MNWREEFLHYAGFAPILTRTDAPEDPGHDYAVTLWAVEDGELAREVVVEFAYPTGIMGRTPQNAVEMVWERALHIVLRDRLRGVLDRYDEATALLPEFKRQRQALEPYEYFPEAQGRKYR